ncbi:MAG: hypothetical protein ACXVVQ_00525 [Solirubrobacteraceae bacterium]
MGDTVYESEPHAAPDDNFVPGSLLYAVAGNHGRLRDARRTPLSITAVEPERGEIEVRIDAFEDRGAKWRLPVWEINRLQFARGSQQASSHVLATLNEAVERYDRRLWLEADPTAAAQTRHRVGQQRTAVRERLTDAVPLVDLADHVARCEGNPRLFALVEQFLAARDLLEVDREFAAAMVSNPHAGELVKGHAIVLAELGLCPFSGTVVRDPGLFADPWTRERRAEHIIARLALAQEVWATCVREPLSLYRAAATEGPLPSRSPASFVSCTFASAVAAAHFAGGPLTTCAVVWRQVVEPERLLMTFLETAAMNQQFKEAEAVLIGDPTNSAF